MVSTNGLTCVVMWVIGVVTSWMSSVSIPGKMGECMKASIKKIKSTASEFIHGATKNDMQGGGATASNMALASLSHETGDVASVYGKKAGN